MICPTCAKEGKRSRVYPGMTMTTLIAYNPGYYDESGRWVKNRDPNIITTSEEGK